MLYEVITGQSGSAGTRYRTEPDRRSADARLPFQHPAPLDLGDQTRARHHRLGGPACPDVTGPGALGDLDQARLPGSDLLPPDPDRQEIV